MYSKMDNRHRFVLQHFIAKGILNAKEVKEIFSKSKERFPSEDNEELDLRTFIQVLKDAIAPFNLDIKKGVQEEDGKNFYCLVNTVETTLSRLSSIYQPNELEFFKKLIEQIVDTDDGKVGSLQAVNLSETLSKRMGKEEAEILLMQLEEDKWITKGHDGKISLSVRSILELEQYMKEVYPDLVRTCYMCTGICLLGETCSSCAIKIHKRCAETLFAKQGENRRCPSNDCCAPWGQIVLNSQSH